MVDWTAVAHGLCETLGATARSLREEFPETWAKVEAIKAQPGWAPYAGEFSPADLAGWEERACARCGKPFTARTSKPNRFCSAFCWAKVREARAREAIAAERAAAGQIEYRRARNELARIVEAAAARRR